MIDLRCSGTTKVRQLSRDRPMLLWQCQYIYYIRVKQVLISRSADSD